MKQYFSTLNDREKGLIIIAAFCLFIYTYYALWYSPLANNVSQKQAQLIEKTDTLRWMQKIKKEGHAAKKAKQNLDNSQLLTLLATQLKNNPTLNIPYQLQQTSSGEIQLSFDAVPFEYLIKWLAKINEGYTITIKQFDAQSTESAGVIKLLMILSDH